MMTLSIRSAEPRAGSSTTWYAGTSPEVDCIEEQHMAQYAQSQVRLATRRKKQVTITPINIRPVRGADPIKHVIQHCPCEALRTPSEPIVPDPRSFDPLRRQAQPAQDMCFITRPDGPIGSGR